MRSKKLARRYAQALGELAHEGGVLQEVESELISVQRALGEEQGFRRALESENVGTEEKSKLVREAFGGHLSRLTLNFLLLVISKRRESDLYDMIEEFKAYADEKRGIVEVELTTAQKLEEDQSQEISAKLSQVLGKQVRLTTREDQDLLGGIVARIGDMVMDGSVKTRLDRLGDQLKRAQLN